MINLEISSNKLLAVFSGLLLLAALYLSSLYNYLLFHSFVELFTLLVTFSIFVLCWNSRRYFDNSYLLFLGLAYFFVGGLDTLHMLAYKGMGVFIGYDANLSTQLWIAARYTESISLLIAGLLVNRKIQIKTIFLFYCPAVVCILLLIFYWGIFPACFIEGVGLTPFKKISEYLISLILLISAVLIYLNASEFAEKVWRGIIISISLKIASGLFLTLYVSVYGFSNFIGHYLKLLSFYFIYKAIIETGLLRPYDLLFRKLTMSKGELKKANEELAKQNEKLLQLDKIKDNLISTVTHEIKTPMAKFNMQVYMLESLMDRSEIIKQDKSVYDSMGKIIEVMKATIKREESIVSNVLDLSRLESKSWEFFYEEFQLDKLIEDVLFDFKVFFESNNITVERKIEQVYINSDKVMLYQVLSNLISNAVKYRTQSLKPWVKISLKSSNDKAYMKIMDNGIGLSKEEISKIYDKFYQASPATSGSGVGLSIVKMIIDELDGMIKYESGGKNKGVTVYIELKGTTCQPEKSKGF